MNSWVPSDSVGVYLLGVEVCWFLAKKSANYSIYFHNLFYEEFKAIKIVKI